MQETILPLSTVTFARKILRHKYNGWFDSWSV